MLKIKLIDVDNNKGIIIPKPLTQLLNFEIDQEFEVTVEDGKIVLVPIKDEK